MHFILPEYGKLLVATGMKAGPNSFPHVTTIEIVNLLGPEQTCLKLPDFPKTVQEATGSLFQGQPIICGNEGASYGCGGACSTVCYILFANDTTKWHQLSSMPQKRYGARAVSYPLSGDLYPNLATFLLTFGTDDSQNYIMPDEYLSETGWKQLNTEKIYNPDTYRYSHCATRIDENRIMIIGGDRVPDFEEGKQRGKGRA